VVFGLQMVVGLIGMLLVTMVMEGTILGSFMVGRALLLSRLRGLAKMAQLGAKCVGNQTCRFLTRWLTRNPDCLIETVSTAAAYGLLSAPDVTSLTGQAELGADLAFIAKECLDRTPGGGSRFTHGNSSSSADPPHPRPRSGPELPGDLRGGKWDETGVHVYCGMRNDLGVYVGQTNDLNRRYKEYKGRFDELIPLRHPLTRGEATAVETALVFLGQLLPSENPGMFENQRNPISPDKPYYQDAVDWGMDWIHQNVGEGKPCVPKLSP
jgi:hypothetical protein